MRVRTSEADRRMPACCRGRKRCGRGRRDIRILCCLLSAVLLAGCAGGEPGGTAGAGNGAAESGAARSETAPQPGGDAAGQNGAGAAESAPQLSGDAGSGAAGTAGEQQAEETSSAETEPAAIPDEAKELLADSGIFYGSAERCRMSAEQAEAFAETVRTEAERLRQNHERMVSMDPEVMDGLTPVSGAALIDTGNGLPVLFCAGGSVRADTAGGGSREWERVSSWSIWQYMDGKAELYQRGREDMFGCVTDACPTFYRDYLMITQYWNADDYDRTVYPYEDGMIAEESSAGVHLLRNEDEEIFVVDGEQKDEEACRAWTARWDVDPLASFTLENGSQKGEFAGLTDAETFVQALMDYAAAAGRTE